MKPVYLDYAATTPVDARVLKAMLPYFCEQYGNPSSLYSFGREARQAVSQARRQLASLLGAEPDEIFFTSGGSESDNWVIRSLSEEALRHGGGISSRRRSSIMQCCAPVRRCPLASR
ncbi:aminotransferase class V-fold PLP-dependent enzyme [Mitsuokella jalaludinii]|uniref:aminotransferase class V-fold PLP-dependent enzyme n=1 Tax=Mitsuokella jalaludinii TaxID=187979 RepID=UPI003079566A